MNKIKITLIGVISLGIGVIASCKKDNPPAIERSEPSLSALFMRFVRHQATDSIPVLPQGISVHLYSSMSDLNSRVNQIGATLTPDSFGQIHLPAPVDKKSYFWWAEIDNSCLYNVGFVDASTNFTHSTYAELSSPDTLIILNNDTCSTCNTYTVYMKPASDYLASKYVPVGEMRWVPTDTAKHIPAHYKNDTIPKLPIGVNNVRIIRDATVKTGLAGFLNDSTSAIDTVINDGLVFTALVPFTLHTIDVYSKKIKGTWTIKFQLQDSSGSVLLARTDTITSPGKNTLLLDWYVPVHNDMRLVRVAGGTADSLSNDPGRLISPLPIKINGVSFGNITAGFGTSSTNDYNVAFNWNTSYIEHAAVDTTFDVNMNCNTSTNQPFPY